MQCQPANAFSIPSLEREDPVEKATTPWFCLSARVIARRHLSGHSSINLPTIFSHTRVTRFIFTASHKPSWLLALLELKDSSNSTLGEFRWRRPLARLRGLGMSKLIRHSYSFIGARHERSQNTLGSIAP